MTDATAAARASRGTPSVAVVGLACRFPDADDPAALLDVVLTGRRSFRRLPPGRIDLADYYQADLATSDATYSTRAALIEGWQFELRGLRHRAGRLRRRRSGPLAGTRDRRPRAGRGGPPGRQRPGPGPHRRHHRQHAGRRDLTGQCAAGPLALRPARANARHSAARRSRLSQAGIVLRQAESSYLAPFPAMGPNSLAGSMPGTIAAAISTYFGFRGGSHAVDSACSSSLQAVASACAALASGRPGRSDRRWRRPQPRPARADRAGQGRHACHHRRPDLRREPDRVPARRGLRRGRADADRRRPRWLACRSTPRSWAGAPRVAACPARRSRTRSSQLLAMRRAYERAGVDPADIQIH